MQRPLVIFEGYDGSGKSTLIQAVQDSCPAKAVRVINRKDEPALQSISEVIDDDARVLRPDTELLLRIAIETERHDIVISALETHDLVLVDRGILSLRSWVDYYGLPSARYLGLFDDLEKRSEGAVLVVCTADFDTCWSRIESRALRSRKELQGKERNRLFYKQYFDNVRRFDNNGYQLINVDTTQQSIEASVQCVLNGLTRQGV